MQGERVEPAILGQVGGGHALERRLRLEELDVEARGRGGVGDADRRRLPLGRRRLPRDLLAHERRRLHLVDPRPLGRHPRDHRDLRGRHAPAREHLRGPHPDRQRDRDDDDPEDLRRDDEGRDRDRDRDRRYADRDDRYRTGRDYGYRPYVAPRVVRPGLHYYGSGGNFSVSEPEKDIGTTISVGTMR